jgi:SPP1 family predicted phage head-tail adaptor
MNINGIPTNPGELRTPVYFGSPANNQDSGGFKKNTYTAEDDATLVRWRNAHGAEVWEAQAAGATRTATLLCRYRSDIDETWGVKKGSQWYEIVSLDNIQERNEYLEIKVKAVVSG